MERFRYVKSHRCMISILRPFFHQQNRLLRLGTKGRLEIDDSEREENFFAEQPLAAPKTKVFYALAESASRTGDCCYSKGADFLGFPVHTQARESGRITGGVFHLQRYRRATILSYGQTQVQRVPSMARLLAYKFVRSPQSLAADSFARDSRMRRRVCIYAGRIVSLKTREQQ